MKHIGSPIQKERVGLSTLLIPTPCYPPQPAPLSPDVLTEANIPTTVEKLGLAVLLNFTVCHLKISKCTYNTAR